MTVKIAPSILSADFARLGEQVRETIRAGVEYLHVDVMDGQFVPNITIGPLIVEALKPLTKAGGVIMDVHLMIYTPDQRIADFAKAGADMLTVHVETCTHLHRTVEQIKEHGMLAGVTLNPATPLVSLDEILSYVDLALVMSVNPGFGGQSYIPTSTAKISRLRQMLDERGLSGVELQVDGGVKPGNAAELVQAGATVLVAGSAIYNSKATITENIAALRQAVQHA